MIFELCTNLPQFIYLVGGEPASTSKPSELTTEKGKSVINQHRVTVALSPLAQSTHTAQPKTNKAASKPTRTSINTGNKRKRANSAPPSPERPKSRKALKSNSSRKIIPESDEEDDDDDDEGQEGDSDDADDDDDDNNGPDEEIEAAYAKLQADRLAEGQGKVYLLLNLFFYY